MLAMLQSTGKSQVVSSHRRRTDNASEVVFRPRLRRGLDHVTASLRFAALASHALRSEQAGKSANKKKKRKEENHKREEMGKKKDTQKEPNDLKELCAFPANVPL